MKPTSKTRRYFTEAAREAAARARRQKGAERLADADRSKLALFVVRAADPSNRFRWEIRRFGALMPVRQSADWYDSPGEAMAMGELALSALNEHASPQRASAPSMAPTDHWDADERSLVTP